MKTPRLLSRAALALLIAAPPLAAQAWRQTAAGVGATARVLIIGTHPEDEDNALIAWLSLGRHVETAYLSLTRGEAAPNVAGNERQSALGVVRTAELLAERQRDGAHQYFTRAYDFGATKLDSIVDLVWPHDSLVHDVVSVVRAFRPHVIISLYSADSTERNATHRVAARLAREAFALAGDSARLSSRQTNLMPPWTVSRLLTRVDSAAGQTGLVTIDVGEFDRVSGRTYVELGAEIRRLQRTQPPPPAPELGHLQRFFRVETARTEGHDGELFADVDTTVARMSAAVPAAARASFDSLGVALASVHARAATGDAASLAELLALVVKRATDVRTAMQCRDVDGVSGCGGTAGDLAVSLATIRRQATRAFVGAANIVIDGTVARELVADGDSVPLTVNVFNGGLQPLVIRQLSATSGSSGVQFIRSYPTPPDTVPPPPAVVAPDSVMRWTGNLRVNTIDFHWWQYWGLQKDTWLHKFPAPPMRPVVPQLITGEDRIPASGVNSLVTIAGFDVPVSQSPLVSRRPGNVRGDDRHPLTGVGPISILLDKTAEYERAGLPIDRLMRVTVTSPRPRTDTIVVTLNTPAALKPDSVKRIVIVPPFGEAVAFFRLHGLLKPGQDSISASAEVLVPASGVTPPAGMLAFQSRSFKLGWLSRDYPHIPTQQFQRQANERLEIVDLRVPARLRVAYVKGTDDVQSPLGQLQINLQALDASLLSVLDLSSFTTVLIGAGALEGGALATAVPALHEFMRKGGTVVVMPGGQEVASSGLLPYPIVFDSTPSRVGDPSGEVHTMNAKSALLTWPNAITADDFFDWNGERARGVPLGYDLRYRTVLSVNDPGQQPTAATILEAPVGKGRILYTSLSLDRQLAAVVPGAARLFVNLLSAGLEASPTKK